MSILSLKELKKIPLLKCPCCGNEAKIFKRSVSSGGPESCDAVGVKCSECLLEVSLTSYVDYEVNERLQKAIECWNKRV